MSLQMESIWAVIDLNFTHLLTLSGSDEWLRTGSFALANEAQAQDWRKRKFK